MHTEKVIDSDPPVAGPGEGEALEQLHEIEDELEADVDDVEELEEIDEQLEEAEEPEEEEAEAELEAPLDEVLRVVLGRELEEAPEEEAFEPPEPLARERRADEFLCTGCFLLKKVSQLADREQRRCRDCVDPD